MDTGAKGLSRTMSNPQLRGFDVPESSTTTGGHSRSGGFSGHLDGTTVADLVQLECASARTGAIRVQSQGRTGYLCFERGSLVHAIAPGALGDAAVLQILAWQDGSFEPARVRWPSTPTVRSSWQHLLLRAAHAEDEKARGKVVEFPPERSKPVGEPSLLEEEISSAPENQVVAPRSSASPAPQAKMTMQNNSLDLGLSEPTSLRELVKEAVRLDTSGRVVATRGGSEVFSGMVAYSKRLGDLIGEALGAGKLRCLKRVSAERQTLIYEEDGGSIVGISTSATSNLAALDRKLGL